MAEFKFEQRPYQQTAVETALAHVRNGEESVIIESPVGSGKTIMGLLVIKALQQENPDLKVNWVASRRHILQQMEAVNNAFFHCKVVPVSVFNATPPKADMIVLDEAHHEATQSCLTMYERTQNKITLGLSATPLRTDKMRLSFRKNVRTCTIQSLINQGVLSQYHSYKIPHWNVDLCAKIFCQHPEKWGKSLIFFHTLAECREFAAALAQNGIRCEVVTGSSNKDRQLAMFCAGDVQVIANVSVLSEGFDLPELRSVFLRDANRLPTIQMMGRGLRKSPEKEVCNLIQSEQSKFQCEKIASPLESFRYSKDVWLSCSARTKAIEAMLQHSMDLLENRPDIQLPLSLRNSPGKLLVALRRR